MSEQPVAIVTGAARGIGAATAMVLAERGYQLALVDCERADLEAVCVEAAKFKVDVLPLPGDLADLTFAESVVQSTAERWQRIDLFVNNAAWRELATMRTISVESWEKTMRIGVTTPAFMSRWAAKQMEARRSGVIVNISSIMAEQVGGISPAYVASKGAISSLTYELASLYGPCGIRVVGICPGAIDTDLSRDLSGEGARTSDPLRGFSEDMVMLRRWGSPQEIAKAVAWVASDEASYITGTNLVIDGGWRHQHFPHSLKRRQFPQEYGE